MKANFKVKKSEQHNDRTSNKREISEEANLLMIPSLRKKFKCKVGYIGHIGAYDISISAVMLGATSIERHITLDRTMYGSVQAASLEPPALKRLVSNIRQMISS